MKPCKPKIPPVLEPSDDVTELLQRAREGQESIENRLIAGIQAPSLNAYKLEFTGVEFDHCRLNGSVFDKASFVDVRFRDCDLSGCSFSDAYFSRCEFLSCKWVGAGFTAALLRQSAAQACSFQYANFDGASLGGVTLRQCDCTGAAFTGVTLRDVATADNRFIGVNFFHTSLKGMDFTRDLVDGWMLSEGLSELKGAIFSPYQAVDLARLLGIEIKSD